MAIALATVALACGGDGKNRHGMEAGGNSGDASRDVPPHNDAGGASGRDATAGTGGGDSAGTGGSAGADGGAGGAGGAPDLDASDAGLDVPDATDAPVEMPPPQVCDLVGAKRCMGDVGLEVCNADRTAWVPQACASGCDTTKNACRLCWPLSKTCDGNVLKECAADGPKTTTCQFGCNATSLVCNACPPNQHVCKDAGTLNVCAADGSSITPMPCPPGCNGTTNECNTCTVGISFCSGNNLVDCPAGTPVVKQTCANGCDVNACRICIPSTKTCTANMVSTCNSAGSAVTTTSCTFGCSSAPQPPGCNVCMPNQHTCAGGTLSVCNAAGSAVLTMPCTPTGACSDAATCQVCTPNQRTCAGGTLNVCNGTGSALVPMTCATGACGDAANCQICTPGAKRCNGANAEVCNSTGLAWTATACGVPGCNATRTICNVCKPGAQICNGATLRTCKADGTGYTDQDCSTLKPDPVPPDNTQNGAGVCKVMDATALTASCVVQCTAGNTLCSNKCLDDGRSGACGCLTCPTWIDGLSCTNTDIYCKGNYQITWTDDQGVTHTNDQITLRCQPGASKMRVNNRAEVDCATLAADFTVCNAPPNIDVAFCCEHNICL